MNKKIIGIVPTSNYLLTNDSFADHYRYCNNYIKKIIENDGIPFLIPVCDDVVLKETLEEVDGVLFPGGNRITDYSLEIMDYCYKNNVPVLGICLGMQTIALYSLSPDKKENFLEEINGHWPKDILRENNTELAHKAIVLKKTKMLEIIGKKEIMVNSVHHFGVKELGEKFKVCIKSEDGIIEGIEYDGRDKLIIGVQFHPEILPQFNNIFKYFIEHCKKRN